MSSEGVVEGGVEDSDSGEGMDIGEEHSAWFVRVQWPDSVESSEAVASSTVPAMASL